MRNACFLLIAALAAGAGAVSFLRSGPRSNAAPANDALATGIIYYRSQWNDKPRMWHMNADGRDKVPLAGNVDGEPSWGWHNGHRWFLSVRAVGAEAGSGGAARYQPLGIRDDGVEVPLATGPDWEPGPFTPRWLPGTTDTLVSWVARRWDGDGRVVEGGVYVARALFDAAGDVIGLSEQSERPRLPLPLVRVARSEPWYAADVPDIGSHDWSPDATQVVFDSTAERLYVADVVTGAARELPAPGRNPPWSPDGAYIAFQSGEPLSAVVVMRPDGTGLRAIPERQHKDLAACGDPVWSPTGGHVAYRWLGDATKVVGEPLDMDVCRARADGDRDVVLTTDTREFVRPVAWRD